jgi:hypothetical protein
MIWPGMTAPDYQGLDDASLGRVRPTLRLEAEALIAEVALRAQRLGVQTLLEPAPQSPEHCCGRGCDRCVWLFFYSEVMCWRDASMQRIATANGASSTSSVAD